MRSPQESFGSVGDRDELLAASMHVYREWSFGGQMGPRLTGLHAEHVVWPDGADLHAECFGGSGDKTPTEGAAYHVCDDVPDSRCVCGIYGYYRPDELWSSNVFPYYLSHSHTPNLFGVAQVAGRCLLGSRGLRAARARVLAVAVPDHCTGGNCVTWGYAFDALHRRYPSVRVFPSRDALLEAYPPSDWESLVGEIAPSPQKSYGPALRIAMALAVGGSLSSPDIVRANAEDAEAAGAEHTADAS
jgi:hypothetical protein